ncbi:gluconate kinase [Rhodoferax koreense]|uniref:Gluconokinase n=1 Tax=Rhodoferax koreensis TaxID=1842727 RepID=A0A1P8JWC5_9BURK|nr:gluconokinase [Rhodoferax koreense]APW38055.1 gluconate kinase [Rhodoferax koreense]
MTSESTSSSQPPIVVVMGVSGCGKSTVGQRLAVALQVPFLEGDDFHPAGNVARMAAGVPLTDADREGWLRTLAGHIAEADRQRQGLVLSCSALKRSYRDMLRAGSDRLRFVFLHGDAAVLAKRMAARTRHYMPASLLDSQLATLEPPAPDENALAFDVTQATEVVVASVVASLQLPP